MIAEKVDYGQYMASREWRLKRRDVIERSDGWCERCLNAKLRDVHHITYERLGHELPEDLLGLCRPCHEFISAEREDDPRLTAIMEKLETTGAILARAKSLKHGILAWDVGPMKSGWFFHFDFKTTPEIDAWYGGPAESTIVIQIADNIWMHGVAL